MSASSGRGRSVGGHLRRADMDEARDLLAGLHAEQRIGLFVEGIPFRQPVGGIAMGVGGHQQVEADGTGRHDLFPFRNLEMRRRLADDGDDNRCAGQAGIFDLDHLFRKIGFRGKRHLRKLGTDARPLLAAIDDEAPGCELAVIRHAGCELQHLLDLGRSGAWSAHLKGRNGAAGRQIITQTDFSFHRRPFPLVCHCAHRRIAKGSHEIAIPALQVEPHTQDVNHLMRITAGQFLGVFTALVFVIAGGSGSRAQDLADPFKSFPAISSPQKMPKLNSFNPLIPEARRRASTAKDIQLEALLTEKGKPVEQGLTWRVFSPIPGSDGKLPLLATSEGGSTAFQLIPGEYFVNVAFGRAGATRKIRIAGRRSGRQAGSRSRCRRRHAECRLRQRRAHSARRTELLASFSADEKEDGERALVVADVKPDDRGPPEHRHLSRRLQLRHRSTR